jgi:NAD(P)-dependent dehydrogenase (short-subunit alcohol dehydrogenase family)
MRTNAKLLGAILKTLASGEGRSYAERQAFEYLFTRELARRLRGMGVTANCLHPGFVATRFGDQSSGLISYLTWFAKFFAISPVKGAETIGHDRRADQGSAGGCKSAWGEAGRA